MARGVNKVILIGNLGQDPEIRSLPSGKPVANMRIATTDSWADRQSGQRQERTEWHSVVLFNKLAEIAQQYVKKGSRLYIEGRLQTRKWQGQDGQDRYSTEIVGNEIQLLDARNDQSHMANQNQQSNYDNAPKDRYQKPPAQSSNPPSSQDATKSAYPGVEPGGFDPLDDEIPF